MNAFATAFAKPALGVTPGEVELSFFLFFEPLFFGFPGGVLGDCERSSSSFLGFSALSFGAGTAFGGLR